MRTLHFDCFSGISGDMTLAALFDLGVPSEPVLAGLASLALPITVKIDKVKKGGFTATHVKIAAPHEHKHRHLSHIEKILGAGTLTDRQRDLAIRIFRRLAVAEAAVHGISIEKVHFHEVGALDSIADIAGSAIALDLLNVEKFTSGPVAVGSGTVKCEHGIMPVPAPATAELLKGVPLRPSAIQTELTTPTGAAILTSIVTEYVASPSFAIDSVGHGAGSKDFPEQPNILRIFLGRAAPSSPLPTVGEEPTSSSPLPTGGEGPGVRGVHSVDADSVWVLETNLDDIPGEVVGYAIEQLFAAGALDVWTTPIQMKKQRPGILLSVIADPANLAAIESILFKETRTFGIRRHLAQRHKLQRESITVETPWGPVKAKRGWREGEAAIVTPEYEECARIAREKNVALLEVMEVVRNTKYEERSTKYEK